MAFQCGGGARSRWVTLAVVFLATAAAPLVAQTPPPRDSATRAAPRPLRILGVFDEDTGQPVEGAEVMDVLSGVSALTTSTGTVSLGFLTAGGSLVRIRKVGYGAQTLTIPMSPADTAPITVTMKRATELPAVVTRDSAPSYLSPILQGFEERRRRHTAGYFIDEKTLRRADGRPLGNVLLANAPGVTIKQMSGSASFLLKSPRCSVGGQPDVYIDGVALAHLPDPRWPSRNRNVADTREFPIDLSQFQVSDLAGVEYYPNNSNMPAQFSRTSAGCGALLLWTRER